MRLRTLAIIVLVFAHATFGQGFDYSALLNPENLKQLDTTYYARGKRVADIAYDGISFESRRKIFNMNIPQTLVIKNLRLTAYARGIDDIEIERLKTKIPFYIIAEDGFRLRIEGMKRVMTLSSKSASLNTDNSITLKGGVMLSIDENKRSLGYEATISIQDGRILLVESLPITFKAKF